MKAKPGPDEAAYVATSACNSFAKNPIVAKTANPAKTPVKQSQDTTMHICLVSTIDEVEKTCERSDLT